MLRCVIILAVVTAVLTAPHLASNGGMMGDHDAAEDLNDVTVEVESLQEPEMMVEDEGMVEGDMMTDGGMMDGSGHEMSMEEQMDEINEDDLGDDLEENDLEEELQDLQDDLSNMSEEELMQLNSDMKKLMHRARRSVSRNNPHFCSGHRAYLPECKRAANGAGSSTDTQAFDSGDGGVNFSNGDGDGDGGSFSSGESGAGSFSSSGSNGEGFFSGGSTAEGFLSGGSDSGGLGGPVIGVRFSHDKCVPAVTHAVRQAVRYVPVTHYNTKFLLLPRTELRTMTETATVVRPAYRTVTRHVTLPHQRLTSTLVASQLRPLQVSTTSVVTATVTTTKLHVFTDTKTVSWVKTLLYANPVTTTLVKTMDISRDDSDLITETRYQTVEKTRVVDHTITSTDTVIVTSQQLITDTAHQYRYVAVTPVPVTVTHTVNRCY